MGDGQINYVLEHEIKAIEKCFQAAGINQADLKFTYIIVSKRINTRFFRYGLPGSYRVFFLTGPTLKITSFFR